MAFESCEQINTLFIQGQEHIERNLIKKKFLPSNAYYGRVANGTFPKRSGLTHRGHRLGRQAPPDEMQWRKIEQDVCNTNACDFDPQIIHNGSDTYNWSLLAFDLRTDWLCLDSLLFNEFPEEEIDHMEMSLQSINRYVYEEFARSRYTNLSEHKYVGLIPSGGQADDFCTNEAVDAGWVFESYANGEVNPNRVRVRLASDEAGRISALSNDLLEQTVIRLQYEEASYIADGVLLYDLVLPDLRSSIQLAREEDEAGNFYKSRGGYQASDLDRDLGVQRVVGNFAHRYDRYAAKYYPAAAADQPEAAAFDETDPTTWLLLIRVQPYRQTAAEIGVKHVINDDYLNAPFAISNVFVKDVFRIESLPVEGGYGSAQRGMASPEGRFEWRNPDWDCNLLRNKGFWLARYHVAAHPRMTELGHSFLHRIDNRVRLVEVPCDLGEAQCYDPVSPYCCDGLQGAEQCDGGENRVQSTKSAY